jgi:hypothetical protein
VVLRPGAVPDFPWACAAAGRLMRAAATARAAIRIVVALLLALEPRDQTECREERRHVREGGASLCVFFYCKREPWSPPPRRHFKRRR